MPYRKMSLVVLRKMFKEINGHNELQNRVSQEFHPLVTAAAEKTINRVNSQ